MGREECEELGWVGAFVINEVVQFTLEKVSFEQTSLSDYEHLILIECNVNSDEIDRGK